MTIRPSQRPYADRLWERVPVWTRVRDRQADGLLQALVSALGVGLDEIQADVERLLGDMFVDTCDKRLIPVIGDLVGVQVDREIDLARQRHQVKYALHLRRRRGTAAAIETMCWQRTGFRAEVFEPKRRPASRRDERSAVITGPAGAAPPRAPLRAVAVSERDGHDLRVVLSVARPVRRREVLLERVRPASEVHAIRPGRDVPLRRSDGTSIFRTDPPGDLVGPGLAIELVLDGGDFPVLGDLAPRFMNLAGDAPIHVPSRTIAIDPERGRVMGPTPPAPGLRAQRRYRLRFWQALGGAAVAGEPTELAHGTYSFAADGATTGLTDEDGNALRLTTEGKPGPLPRADERVIIACEPGSARRPDDEPFVILPPGQPYTPALAAADHAGALALDTAGLARLFSIEDDLGWDAYPVVRLVRGFVAGVPPREDTVEVDLERGRFRIAPRFDAPELRVRYFRRFDVAAARRKGTSTIADNTPLGRTAHVAFKDNGSSMGDI